MKYNGKLYGKIGNKYFDTSKTSEDFDNVVQALIESNKMIVVMLEKNIGGGRHIGKTYLSTIWMSNQKAIDEAKK